MFKDFTRYVSLSILGLIGLSCYILVDTFFISNRLGSLGIAALNFSIPAYSFINGIGLMTGIGGATRFSILKAQNEDNKANVVFSHCLSLGIVIGFIFALIGLLFSRLLAILLGADSYTLSMTRIYLSTILSFSPFFIANNVLLAFVRNDNNPNLPMFGMLFGSLSNIVLDYIFMYPLKMGMFGAAFATGIAPIVSISFVLIHFIKKKNTFRLVRFKLSLQTILDVIKLGISTFITEVSSGIVLITFNLVILRLEGNLGVTSYGIVANLALVGIAIFTGIAQGIQPLVSKVHGERDKRSLKRLLLLASITSILFATVIYALSYKYTESIVSIFNSEQINSVATLAKTGLRIYFIGFFFAGINIVISTYLCSKEMTKDSFVISILRGSIVFIPMVLLLGSLWHMTGVWFSFVFTECIVMFISILFLRKTRDS